MFLKPKHYPIIMLTIALLIGILAIPAMSAESSYREMPIQNEIQPDKEKWTIQFTMPIDPECLTDKNIYIIKLNDQSPHSISFEQSADKKQISVISKTPYNLNSTYCLYIEEGIRSDTNPPVYLKQKIAMPFKTISDKEPAGTASVTGAGEPTLTLNQKDGTVLTGPGITQEYTISGQVDQEAQVEVNGQPVTLSGLEFSTKIVLSNGANKINIKATSQAGKVTQKSVNIQYNSTYLDETTLNDLKNVSRGMEKVINKLSNEKEKEVARAVKSNIDQKIADPSFDHTAEIKDIRIIYNTLTSNQKTELQDAILYNIPVQTLLRLAEYFGFVI